MPDTAVLREYDTQTLAARPADANTYDPNPMYGRVAYTFGLKLDQPLSVVRLGYMNAWNETWNPFSIVPLWTVRGTADTSYFAGTVGTGATNCNASHCVLVGYSSEYWTPAYSRYYVPTMFQGTLLSDKSDHTGQLYRRNRYYDPASGRFTQEDPIGLAGGLNAYGFADGDPVNFSDPLGLLTCPKDVGGDGKTQSVDDCSHEVQDKWAESHIHITAAHGTDWEGVDPDLRSAIVRTSMEFRMDFGISAGKERGHSVEGRHAVGGAADINQANGIPFRTMTRGAAVSVGNAIGAAIGNRLPYGRNLMIYAPGMAFRLNRSMNATEYDKLLAQHWNHVHVSIAP
jgi:RHS repeat-associated protein